MFDTNTGHKSKDLVNNILKFIDSIRFDWILKIVKGSPTIML